MLATAVGPTPVDDCANAPGEVSVARLAVAVVFTVAAKPCPVTPEIEEFAAIAPLLLWIGLPVTSGGRVPLNWLPTASEPKVVAAFRSTGPLTFICDVESARSF